MGPTQRAYLVPTIFCVAAISAGIHAAGSIGIALGHPTLHAGLTAVYNVLRTAIALAFTLFTVGRTAPRRPARQPVAFVACATAMAAPLVLSDPAPHGSSIIIFIGALIAVAACGWLLVAVMFLGSCFGVLPEARGLVTRGPYGVVRHPVYLGEIGACVGLVGAAISVRNLAVLAGIGAAQLVRMRLEERALRAAFPEYDSYAQRVPRLVPRFRRRPALRTEVGAQEAATVTRSPMARPADSLAAAENY